MGGAVGVIEEGEWPVFLDWAAAEGWRVPEVELELFRGAYAGSMYALRADGAPVAFVSAVGHGRSGWIGNLIVDPERRGRGYGATLFDFAASELRRAGVADLWLTASAQGRPLYERRGFRSVGRVARWSAAGRDGGGVDAPAVAGLAELEGGECTVWGEVRGSLLAALASRGAILAAGGSVALLQPGGAMRVLGPWLSPERCPRESRRLLVAALEGAGPGVEVVADVLESSGMAALLAAAGFERRGGVELMVHGDAAGVELGGLVALASLGSIG